ncbi:hypothetical protein WJX75_007856 [Coccomyxa subellipsoidea]|uniref:Uncharacterized protein n=1 Tax=Coccomyxa subellipsoidea TaxID=248742 RepID=A0ABR2YW73_9CHLO
MALLQQHSDAYVQASFKLPSPPPGPPIGILLPKGSALSLDPCFSASGRVSPTLTPTPQPKTVSQAWQADKKLHDRLRICTEPTTAKAEGTSHNHSSSGFLVRQPNSEMWMQAVPMRTGTKPSTSYRVYSNAFREGQRPNGFQGNGHVRPGSPSISSPAQRGRPVLPSPSHPDHERQLSAQMMILDCGAAGAPSLLSSPGAQGSSNLIYILKSLQHQAAQESPREQLALMRMLLTPPNQAPPRQPSSYQPPPWGSPREGAQLDAVKKRCGPAAIDEQWQQGSHRNMTQIPKAPTPPAEAGLLQTRHEEVLQRLKAQAQLRAKTGGANTGNAERMSRIGSVSSEAERQQNGSQTPAFLSKGSPHARALYTSRMDFPSPSEALSGPSLIFNNSATSQNRLKQLKPFNNLHAEQYAADSVRRPGCCTKGGVASNNADIVCAAPARIAVGWPVSRPDLPPQAVPKQKDNPVGQALEPGKEGLERTSWSSRSSTRW